MPTKTPLNVPEQKPRKDEEREQDQAAAKGKNAPNGWDTDKVHGDGGDIGLGKKH